MLYIYFLVIYILLKIYKISVKDYNMCNEEKQHLQLELKKLKNYMKINNINIGDESSVQSKLLQQPLE